MIEGKSVAAIQPVVTRTCSICKQHEYDRATALSPEFWICPKCCEKLHKLINEETSND